MVWLSLVVLGSVLATDVPDFPAIAIILVGVGFAVLSPIGATAACLTALPYVYHLASIGSQQFSLVEVAVLVACGGVGVRVGIALVQGRLRPLLSDLFLPLYLTLAAMGLVAIGSISLAFVADTRYLAESVRELRTTILEPVAVLFLVRFALRRGGLGVLAVGLVAGAVLASLAGAEQFVTRSGGVMGDETYRARGPYPHPNNLALFLERVVLIVAGIALFSPRLRRVAVPCLVVVAVGLALTFSRGAVLGLMAGGAALLALRRPPRGWLLYAGAIAVAITIFGLVAGERLFATGSGGAMSSRELIWRSSLRMLADHPLTGVGLDQFLYQFSRRYVDPAGWSERYTSHPHNLVLDVWLRLGVAGLVIFTALAIVAVRLARSARLEPTLQGAVAGGAIAALVGGVAHGLVDNSYFLPDLAILTWTFLAFVENDAPWQSELFPHLSWRPRLHRMAPT
jgi:O-antigen ligase